MTQIFEDPHTQGVILVDASNAFNNLNREVTLRNILTLCPALSKIIVNTYRDYSKLFVGGESILSREGTTQGDPLVMAMYAVAILPLIDRIKNWVKQIWYADDAAAGGLLTDLRECWDPLKTWIIVKEDHLVDAKAAFQDTDIQFTTEGKRYLGAALGTRYFTDVCHHQG